MSLEDRYWGSKLVYKNVEFFFYLLSYKRFKFTFKMKRGRNRALVSFFSYKKKIEK